MGEFGARGNITDRSENHHVANERTSAVGNAGMI